jgi:hypothetical protein
MVGAAQFARLLVFDPGHRLHLLAGTAHADAALGHFLAWNSHGSNLGNLGKTVKPADAAGRVGAAYSQGFQRIQVR